MDDVLSVGIDIGTSTTQVVFSKIKIVNTAGYFTVPSITIGEKEIVYRSKTRITPLINQSILDIDKVCEIVNDEYRIAKVSPKDVDTGAVIITGESARKENAALIIEKLSSIAGDFVVSTAGPDLESILAGKGSGAWQYSKDHSCRVINLDIGGGTTNAVVFDCGETVNVGCIDIGGRLVRFDPSGRYEYISGAAETIFTSLGIQAKVGIKPAGVDIARLTGKMAELIGQFAGICQKELLLEKLVTSHSSKFDPVGRVEYVCFSGGVADCMFSENVEDFGDIGISLGSSLLETVKSWNVKVIDSSETIRATVVGAGTYTTELSGSTVSYSDGILPLKNLPVLRLNAEQQKQLLSSGGENFLAEQTKWFNQQYDSDKVVYSLPGLENPDYEELKLFANKIVGGAEQSLAIGEPIIVVVESDTAKALGIVLKKLVSSDRRIICLDGIKIERGDYIDMGKPLMAGMVVPVVIKTLLFG